MCRDGVDRAKAPKLQSFFDGKDELDSYLLRFEQFATTNSWDRASWAISLSAFLTGWMYTPECQMMHQ